MLYKNVKKNIYLSLIGGLFVFLIIYRTFVPIQFKTNILTVNNIYEQNISENHLILENDNLFLSINTHGGFINNIFFKKYNKIFFPSSNTDKDKIYDNNNSLQTGWFSYENTLTPHRTKTKWNIVENSKNKIILTTTINNIEFNKIFILENDKLLIEDNFKNINNSTDVILYNYGGFSLIPDDQEKKSYNFFTYNQKNNIIKISNLYNKNKKKESISKSNNNMCGLEDENFLLTIQSNNGEIYFDTDGEKNKFYYSSNDIYTPNKKYTVYLIPKNYQQLKKYNINNLISYNVSGFFKYILYPFQIITYILYNLAIYINNYISNSLISLFIILLIIILINFYFIYLIENEKIKIKIHIDEKNFIENNYPENQQEHLGYFYKKHNIKIYRMVFLSLMTHILFVLLNKTIELLFFLKNQSFLYLNNIMAHDTYSILNLYGLLPISLPGFITTNISTDIFSIIGIYLYFYMNTINNEFNDNAKNNPHMNNNIFKFIQIVLFSTLVRNLSSCFMISAVLILICNIIFQYFYSQYLSNKYTN